MKMDNAQVSSVCLAGASLQAGSDNVSLQATGHIVKARSQSALILIDIAFLMSLPGPCSWLSLLCNGSEAPEQRC